MKFFQRAHHQGRKDTMTTSLLFLGGSLLLTIACAWWALRR
jgi:hypothetical protein